MLDLAYLCYDKGMRPNQGQCIGFKIPPVLGGKIEIDNLDIYELTVYQAIMGQIHEQVKDCRWARKLSSLLLPVEMTHKRWRTTLSIAMSLW
jgi:hypothetical protein